MGMAAGLIRQRCDEEPSQLQTIPNCHRWHLSPCQDIFRKDDTVVEWKRRVDLCSLLIVSVPFLSLLLSPNLPFLPRLGLLANVLFVLPQLIVITGFTTTTTLSPFSNLSQQDYQAKLDWLGFTLF